MWTVVHHIPVLNGNVYTYWHHVMQLTVMIAERVFWAETNTSSAMGKIMIVTPNATGVRAVVDKYGWVPTLGLPIWYSTTPQPMDSYNTFPTTRTCDPLHAANRHEGYCAGVLQQLRQRVVDYLGLQPVDAHAKRQMLVVAREPWMSERKRRIDNLEHVLALATTAAVSNGVEVMATTMHNASLKLQLQLFYSAAFVVLQRGSANANLIVVPDSCKVILLTSPDQWRPTCWIPPPYRIHFAVVVGGNFDKTVHADTDTLRRALTEAGLKEHHVEPWRSQPTPVAHSHWGGLRVPWFTGRK